MTSSQELLSSHFDMICITGSLSDMRLFHHQNEETESESGKEMGYYSIHGGGQQEVQPSPWSFFHWVSTSGLFASFLGCMTWNATDFNTNGHFKTLSTVAHVTVS